jgi:hypothetical protein
MGALPGSIMQNFKFLGYLNGDPSHGLQTIALADYYDPCQKRIKLLHLSVAGVWCVPCNQETDAIVTAKPQLDAAGVVMIQALGDGATEGIGATPADLNYWVHLHKSNFTEMLDPNLQNLGGFFDATAIPWNCDIDPRTMEILHESLGWGGDVLADLQPSLDAVALPPGVPIQSGVTCN